MAEKIICPTCGAELDEGTTVCPYCRVSFVVEDKQEVLEEVEEILDEGMPEAEEVLAEDAEEVVEEVVEEVEEVLAEDAEEVEEAMEELSRALTEDYDGQNFTLLYTECLRTLRKAYLKKLYEQHRLLADELERRDDPGFLRELEESQRIKKEMDDV